MVAGSHGCMIGCPSAAGRSKPGLPLREARERNLLRRTFYYTTKMRTGYMISRLFWETRRIGVR